MGKLPYIPQKTQKVKRNLPLLYIYITIYFYNNNKGLNFGVVFEWSLTLCTLVDFKVGLSVGLIV